MSKPRCITQQEFVERNHEIDAYRTGVNDSGIFVRGYHYGSEIYAVLTDYHPQNKLNMEK